MASQTSSMNVEHGSVHEGNAPAQGTDQSASRQLRFDMFINNTGDNLNDRISSRETPSEQDNNQQDTANPPRTQ
ncbi:hypothetical protein CkaCkLH20_08977 [Colletotrichum karsti]|uniref:Uncharacterized protein n=1 Tax=Colletotrichum karsti TaxID=1095194 RepID=A0A9P6HXV5_9PEZI|nr:uncharacterized protein CkaCkLH20_08977 [Colletotrichum karsti]KAF9873518.1 hypothetical protein CkaCkLH20_08977 [Colletotrichum karsti]